MTINHEEQLSKRKSHTALIGLSLVVLVLTITCCGLSWWVANAPYLALRKVPVHPEAVMRMDARNAFWTPWNDAEPTISYDVHHSWPEIEQFYRDAMEQQGWKLEKENSGDSAGMVSGRHFHNVCLVFRYVPMFVATVEILGESENSVILSDSVVTVNPASSNKGACP